MKYLDSELSDSEHAQLIHHINKCDNCCAEFQQYNSIKKALEEDEEIEPPENFEIKVMNKIKAIENSAKLIKEKRLVILYFVASIIFSLGIIICSVFLKDYILEFMKYVGVPTGITYTIYGILSNIGYMLMVLIRLIYCFNSMYSETYYVFLGLFVIAAMSKIYGNNEVKCKKDESVDVLQNE
jgi:hypothetical protein